MASKKILQDNIENLSEGTSLQVKQLKQWLYEQPLFPKDIEQTLVIRFLHSNNYDLEKAKKTAEAFFTTRAQLSEVLIERDYRSAKLQKVLKIINFAIYQLSGNRNLCLCQINDPGLSNYDYTEEKKIFFLIMDAFFIENKNLERENIFIFDMKDITFKYVTKFKIGLFKRIIRFQQEGLPIKLTWFHIVNASRALDYILGITKPFMNKSTADMINFHRVNSTTLFDFFNKDELPSDFGGTRPSMEELKKTTIQLLERNRDRIIQDMLWTKNKYE